MSDVRKIIRTILDEVFEEGLISTHSDKAIDILNKKFKNNIESKQNEDDISIDVFIKKYDYKILINILSLVENLGYIISKFSIKGNQFAFNKNNFFLIAKDENYQLPIYLKIEPKFDNSKIEIPAVLYHVTHERHLDKIKKIGLVPKSKSKKAFHSERIYLFKNKESANVIAKEFSRIDYQFEHNYILLPINTLIIPNLQLHVDPNFKNDGFYTYDNVPPSAIKIDSIEKIRI